MNWMEIKEWRAHLWLLLRNNALGLVRVELLQMV